MTYDSRFIYEFIGYNFQPIELEAAFGLQQLRRLDEFLAIRQKNFDRLKAFFSQYEDRFVLPETRAGANWLAFPLTIREGLDRTDFARHLEQNEIQTRPIFSGNIARQPAYRDVLQQGSFPVADKVMADGLLLGCHHGMNEEQLTYLEEVCSAYLAT
jgi:CDP-6-deoxy-D-xylo-4-hexulose-3-dehydrase